jgi:hypothetical protein
MHDQTSAERLLWIHSCHWVTVTSLALTLCTARWGTMVGSGPFLSHLTYQFSDCIAAVLSEFRDVLTPILHLTELHEYDIRLLNHTLVNFPYTGLYHLRSLSRASRSSICWSRRSLELPPHSTLSLVLLVSEGEGGFCPLVDYPAMNQEIKIKSVPLPDSTIPLVLFSQSFHLFGFKFSLSSNCFDWTVETSYGFCDRLESLPGCLLRLLQEHRFLLFFWVKSSLM